MGSQLSGGLKGKREMVKILTKTCSKTSSIVCSILQRRACPVCSLHSFPQKTAGQRGQGRRQGRWTGSWTRQVAQWLGLKDGSSTAAAAASFATWEMFENKIISAGHQTCSPTAMSLVATRNLPCSAVSQTLTLSASTDVVHFDLGRLSCLKLSFSFGTVFCRFERVFFRASSLSSGTRPYNDKRL